VVTLRSSPEKRLEQHEFQNTPPFSADVVNARSFATTSRIPINSEVVGTRTALHIANTNFSHLTP
jgi:hypothetical protein